MLNVTVADTIHIALAENIHVAVADIMHVAVLVTLLHLTSRIRLDQTDNRFVSVGNYCSVHVHQLVTQLHITKCKV